MNFSVDAVSAVKFTLPASRTSPPAFLVHTLTLRVWAPSMSVTSTAFAPPSGSAMSPALSGELFSPIWVTEILANLSQNVMMFSVGSQVASHSIFFSPPLSVGSHPSGTVPSVMVSHSRAALRLRLLLSLAEPQAATAASSAPARERRTTRENEVELIWAS